MSDTKKLLIDLNNVSVSYEGVEAIKNINLKIYEKDFIAILGPNGGGKTTLMKALLNLVPYQGAINIASNIKLGYVPQFKTFDKNFPISVIDTVLMGAISTTIRPFYKPSKADITKATSLLSKFEMDNYINSQLNNLSGGQLQKVLICRALMSDCDILILDEPTASLDFKVKNNTFKLLKDLNKDITIIVVSHDISVLSSYVKSFICLNQTLHCNERHLNNEKLKKLYGDHVNFIEHRH